MSHIEKAVTYSKKIEGLLADNYGAIGKGLHEKLSSVDGRLPSDIVRKIRYIASVRNKLVHHDGYVLDDPDGFVQSCEAAIRGLASNSKKQKPHDGVATSRDGSFSSSVSGRVFRFFLGIFYGVGYVLVIAGQKLAWWVYGFLLLARGIYGYNEWMTESFGSIHRFAVISFSVLGLFSIKMYDHDDEYKPVAIKLVLHMLAYAVLSFYVGDQTLAKSIWSGILLGTGSLAAVLFLLVWKGKPPAEEKVATAVTASGDSPSEDYATPVQATQPKTNFSHIFGMQAIKTKLLDPARLIVAERRQRQGSDSPANGILLHGEPGNGKTIFAEALAGELQLPFVQLTYGDVSSKWVGEMPRLISNCFAYAKQHAPCVLFIDEIDSFIRSRDAGGSNEESLKITNTLLTEIVNLRDHRVVLIGATNYLANLDAAAIREGRFDYKIEITPPDEEARIGILTQGVAKHAAHLAVEREALLSVAKRWNGFSVSRLLAVVKALPRYAQEQGLTAVGYNDWMATLREVQGRNGRVPKDTKSISELVLDGATREALNMVANRLKDAQRIESLGGTLPSGVLFHGPAGTGKTAAARALAKECGWAFLSVAGPDLMAERDKISKLYAEAKDIRPTLIFIDEADDVLRNRQYSNTPDLTNRLLVLMDGTEEKVKDVVFIAATNHPDQIDPALLRAGRFTEKVEFAPPPADQIPRFVSGWLKGKKLMLAPELDAFDLAALLEGQTIANIEGVLQYALNRAIHQHQADQPLLLTHEDVQAGLRVVLAGNAA